MDILNQFGVQPILLAAQVVNFLILLFILKRFFYKPILKILEERKNKIANSIKQAEEIEKRLLSLESEREERLKKADAEAKAIIIEAGKQSDSLINDARLKAKHEIEKLIEKNNEAMRKTRDKLYQEIRMDLANLISIGLQKITKGVLTKKDHQDLIKETVKNL